MITDNYHDEFLSTKLRYFKMAAPEGFTARVMAMVYELNTRPQRSISTSALLYVGLALAIFSVMQIFVVFFLLDFFNISLVSVKIDTAFVSLLIDNLLLAIELITSYIATLQISVLTLLAGGLLLVMTLKQRFFPVAKTRTSRFRTP